MIKLFLQLSLIVLIAVLWVVLTVAALFARSPVQRHHSHRPTVNAHTKYYVDSARLKD